MPIVNAERFITLSLDQLVKADWNYKQDDAAMLNKLVENLKRNGQVENIIVRELGTGFYEIANGNHRFDALKIVGASEVVAYNLGKVSLAAAKRLAIETNETKFASDELRLAQLIGSLGEEFKVEDLLNSMPYDEKSLVQFLASNGGGYGGEPGQLQDPPVVEPRDIYVRPGDLIQLGDHALRCSSCTAPGVLTDLAGKRSVHCVVTDPPYGVAYVGKTKEALTIQNDALDEESLAKLWSDTLDALLAVMRDGAGIYASVPSVPTGLVFEVELKRRGILRQRLCWNKDSMVLGHSDYHYKHEPILYGWKPGAAHYFVNDRTKTSVLEFARPKASEEHPTMKPIALWSELIGNSTKRGQLVADPFLGSGTTLLACEELGRVCIGTEIEPKYCQVIIDRYAALCETTGKEFVCTINGKPIEECAPVSQS